MQAIGKNILCKLLLFQQEKCVPDGILLSSFSCNDVRVYTRNLDI